MSASACGIHSRRDAGGERQVAPRTRVALLQSTVGYDGRSQTLAHVIRLVNDRGIRPTLFTFSSPVDVAAMERNAGFSLDTNMIELRRPRLAVGHHLEQLAMSRLVRPAIDDFDIVYASDTSVYGFSDRQLVIRLVCFPLELVARYEERYRRPVYRLYQGVARAFTAMAARGFVPHGVWLANSEFTKAAMLEAYGLAPDEVAVVYPPVVANTSGLSAPRREVRDRLVVSIGGFHEDKRQLEQIALAKELPDAAFALIGSVRSHGYLERCRKAAAGLENVFFHVNASPEEADGVLRRARVFLHSKRYEHFGMSAVEAVLAGCVPVVHDSGGQRETVPVPDLRYSSNAEALERVRAALDGKYDEYLPTLERVARSFRGEVFGRRMGDVIDAALGRVRV